MTHHSILPAGLPEPLDDGAADHLIGLALPSVPLDSSAGHPVDLAQLRGRTALYVYPMSREDDSLLPDGWTRFPVPVAARLNIAP